MLQARKPVLQYDRRRSLPRTNCNVIVQIQELNDRLIHWASIGNYSEKGLYFEAGKALHPGAEIYLGIDKSLYKAAASVHNRYRARIVWIRKLENSIHCYGYGAVDISDAEKQNLPGSQLNGNSDLRKHVRRSYVKSVFCITPHQYRKGLTNNISRGGGLLKLQMGFRKVK